MPLSPLDRGSLTFWLRQIADEIDRGEHFETSIFTLGGNRERRV